MFLNLPIFSIFFAQDGKTSAKNSKAKDLAKNALCSTFYTSALKRLVSPLCCQFPKNFYNVFSSFFLSRRRQDFLRRKLRRLCLLTSKTDWRNCDGSDNSTDRITSSIVNSWDTITLSCIIWSKEERKKRFYSHFVPSEKSFCCRSASKKTKCARTIQWPWKLPAHTWSRISVLSREPGTNSRPQWRSGTLPPDCSWRRTIRPSTRSRRCSKTSSRKTGGTLRRTTTTKSTSCSSCSAWAPCCPGTSSSRSTASGTTSSGTRAPRTRPGPEKKTRLTCRSSSPLCWRKKSALVSPGGDFLPPFYILQAVCLSGPWGYSLGKSVLFSKLERAK